MTLDVEAVIRLLEGLALVGGGGFVLFKMGRAVATFEQISSSQSKEISELKDDMKEVAKVMTNMAAQHERMNAMDRRLAMAEEAVNDMRHGAGFIVPPVRTIPNT